MTLEELEFLRRIADDDTILKTYKQLKVEGKTNEEIIDYLEYCDVGATSHEEFDLWIYGGLGKYEKNTSYIKFIDIISL